MVNEHPSIDPDLLLAQTGWVRYLARNLVKDPNGAEDLEQEAFLAALKAPPADARDSKRLRAWLTRVVQNLSNLSRRGNARRQAREEDVARTGHTSSVAETVERATQLRLLVDAVMELDEPYRSSILLRYFEGLSTAEISTETGASQAAVRKRMSRALCQLRERLDGEYDGDRRAWFAALAPLARLDLTLLPKGAELAENLAGSASKGGLQATSAVTSGLLLGGGLLAVTAILTVGRVEPSQELAAAPAATHDLELGGWDELVQPSDTRVPIRPRSKQEGSDLEPRQEAGEETVRIIEPERVAEPPPEQPQIARTPVRGYVVGLDGARMPGLEIAVLDAPEEILGKCDANGVFELSLERLDVSLVASGANIATLRTSHVTEVNYAYEHVLVASKAISVAGHVVDHQNRPLAGAEIAIEYTPQLFADLAEPIDRTVATVASSYSDADGRFALEGLVSGEGAFLRTSFGGYLEQLTPVPSQPTAELRIVLGADPVPHLVLTGEVLHADDRPAAGAQVRLGAYSTQTDALGAFTLSYGEVDEGADLLALKDGFQAGVIENFGKSKKNGRLAMVLGARSLSIRGSVFDGQGDPARGWFVYATAQDLPEGGASVVDASGDDLYQDAPLDLDQGSLNDGRASLSMTDDKGRFSIDGLNEGEYFVHAYDPSSLVMTRVEGVRAGQESIIHVASDALREQLAGKLQSETGEPLANALLTVSLPVKTASGAFAEAGVSVLTDSQGEFAFHDVPRNFIGIRIQHPGVNDGWRPVPSTAPNRGWRMRVFNDTRLMLRDLEGLYDSFGARDEEDRELPLYSGFGGVSTSAALTRGRSGVLRVASNVRTLIVYKDGEEAARIPVSAPAGEILSILP